jgi:hypothetical protein
MKKSTISTLFLSAIIIIFSTSSYDMHMDDENGKAGKTGSPGETTCAESGCHTGTAVNSGPGSVTINCSNMMNWEYVPGQQYTISVTVAENTKNLFGLGVEALKSNGDNAGTLVAGTGTQIKTKTVSGFVRKNIVHNTNTGAGTNSHTFTFIWNAPTTDVGDVTFYVAGNATNNNGSDSGDHIYTISQVATAAVGVYEIENEKLDFTLYPNPTENQLNISYKLPTASNVSIKVFDTRGVLIKTLSSNNQPAGTIQQTYDMTDLSAGIYMFQIIIDNKISSCKIFQKI